MFLQAAATTPKMSLRLLRARHAIKGSSCLNSNTKSRSRGISSTTIILSRGGSDPHLAAIAPTRADHDYCVELVQNRDREGYLCGLLMPSSSRKAYFAVRALNVELASIKDSAVQVSRRPDESFTEGSAMSLKMRMQWWRDALYELYPDEDGAFGGGPTQMTSAGFLNEQSAATANVASTCWHNPVIRVLYDSIRQKNLTRRFLERLLDARDADLTIQQMATVDDVVAYADDTCGSLLSLSLETVIDPRSTNPDAMKVADEMAHHVGVAWGVTNAIRSTVHRAITKSEMALPRELFPDGTVVPPDYLLARLERIQDEEEAEEEGKDAPATAATSPNEKVFEEALNEAVKYMAYLASHHLTKARAIQNDLPKAARPALVLPAMPVQLYLAKLQRETDYDLFHPSLLAKSQEGSARLVLLGLLARGWWTGKL